ncbi:hypothetical protein FCM30_18605 [Lelliottia aquatilis]|uniref:hypothetical protein n=1 Tax=Lelliottia aquatilis TaxID=2080838 RepID=UPI001575A0A5|nr:hypothetical protein [Lelliottia aquatilis]NTZ47753.1 hypothetical protein [Lelliottia aquatilis]
MKVSINKKALSAVAVGVLLGAMSAPALAAAATSAATATVTGHPPVAAPLPDKLTLSPGETVTVSGGFSDPDGDPEDATAAGTGYQWMRETAPASDSYEPVDGATGKTYTALPADVGKHLKAVVTPRTAAAQTDPSEGTPVTSAAMLVTGVADVTTSTLAVRTAQANNTITADDGTSPNVATVATLTLTLKTAQALPVIDKTVTFAVTPADAGTKITAVSPGTDGTYTATVTATKAQDYTVTPELDGQAFGVSFPNLTAHLKVAAAALDGPASSVIVPLNAALEGTPLNVDVYPRDRFRNQAAVNVTDIKPHPTTIPGHDLELTNSAPIASAHGGGYELSYKPKRTTDAARRNAVDFSVGSVSLDDTDTDPRPMRWTPRLKITVADRLDPTTPDAAVYPGGELAIAGASTDSLVTPMGPRDLVAAGYDFVPSREDGTHGLTTDTAVTPVHLRGKVTDNQTSITQDLSIDLARVALIDLRYPYDRHAPTDYAQYAIAVCDSNGGAPAPLHGTTIDFYYGARTSASSSTARTITGARPVEGQTRIELSSGPITGSTGYMVTDDFHTPNTSYMIHPDKTPMVQVTHLPPQDTGYDPVSGVVCVFE